MEGGCQFGDFSAWYTVNICSAGFRNKLLSERVSIPECEWLFSFVGGNGSSSLEVAHTGACIMDRGQMEARSEESSDEGLRSRKFIYFLINRGIIKI